MKSPEQVPSIEWLRILASGISSSSELYKKVKMKKDKAEMREAEEGKTKKR
jgi:hypothetical protein